MVKRRFRKESTNVYLFINVKLFVYKRLLTLTKLGQLTFGAENDNMLFVYQSIQNAVYNMVTNIRTVEYSNHLICVPI